MNYTFSLYTKKGVDVECLEKVLSRLYRRAILEEEESGCTRLETKAWKEFEELRGDVPIPLTGYSEELMKQLCDHVNRSFESRSKLICEQIFPNIEIFREKLSCNPLLLTEIFAKLISFTGTLMSGSSMHRKLKPTAESGTTAQTLVALWRMRNERVLEIKKGSPESMLSMLKQADEPCDLISDAGGYFKEGGNEGISKVIQTVYGKAVAYYNDKNEKTLLSGDEKVPLANAAIKESDRITFLDQSHTTGSDIDQSQAAKGWVTIGRNMTLRDFLQAVWRLRGLGKGQVVQYLIDDEVKAIIIEKLGLQADSTITLIEILEFVIENQCEKLGDDNFKAYKQELAALIQRLLFGSLMRQDLSPINKKAAYTRLRESWIKKQDLSFAEQFGEPALLRPKDEVLKEEAQKCETALNELGSELFFLSGEASSSVLEIPKIVEKYRHVLHPEIISPISDDSETMEISQELKTDQMVFSECELESDQQKRQIQLGVEELIQKPAYHGLAEAEAWLRGDPPAPNKVNPLTFRDFLRSEPLFISEQMQKQPEMQELAPYFEGIRAVGNVFEWEHNPKISWDKSINFCFMGNHPTPVHYLRVMQDDVVMLSQVERRLSNYNLAFGPMPKKEGLTRSAFEKIVKIKFLNGYCNMYTKDELEFLKSWLQEAGAARMRKFFLQTVLKTRPDDVEDFYTSQLGRVFSRL